MSSGLLSVAGITSVISVILTLLFQYFPGLRVVWGGVESNVKKLIVLGAYVVVGAVVAFGGCAAGLVNLFPELGCVGARTFVDFLFGVLVALGAGQGGFGILPGLGGGA